MNSLLLQTIKKASPAKADEVRGLFRNSQLMLRLIHFIENVKAEDFQSTDAVCFVYEISKTNKQFSTFENRFYKLRKKLYDTYTANAPAQSGQFPVGKQWLYEAQRLMQQGKFHEAQQILSKTEKHCWQNNIFEILPEVTDTLIQCNQAMNAIDKNKTLYKNFQHTLTLYSDLLLAKNISRRIYEVNFKIGIEATRPLYNRLAKLVVKHRKYPRFKLIYNFVAAYYKTGAGGRYSQQKTYAINRHIAAAQRLMAQYPEMPSVQYSSDFQANQYYRLHEIQAMGYYNNLRYAEAAEVGRKLYDQVMQPDSGLSRLKNEIFFSNTMHIFTYAGRYQEAQQTGRDFLQFLKENKHYSRMPLVFYELAAVHAAMYPLRSDYEPSLLLKKLDELVKTGIISSEPGNSAHGQLLRSKFLASLHRFNEARTTLQSVEHLQVYPKKIFDLTLQVYGFLAGSIADGTRNLLQQVKKEKMQSSKTELYSQLVFLEKLLVNNVA